MSRHTLAVRTAFVVVLIILSGSVVHPQKPSSSDDKEFAKQWAEVKSKYPQVAMAYLQREAFVRAVSEATNSAVQCDGQSRAVVPTWILCLNLQRLNLAVPTACTTISPGPGPDFGACFRPQRTAKGSYEMPSADEAQGCLDAMRRGPH